MVETYEVTGEWFGRLEELVEYIEEYCDVEEYNREYESMLSFPTRKKHTSHT